MQIWKASHRPFTAHNPFFQDFTPLQTVILHSSALEPCLTIPKVPKSMKDLIISQKNEQKAETITAILKDSMQQKPKSQKKIIKASEPQAIFNFTKFFYISTSKETAFTGYKTQKPSFSSVPTIRYLSHDSSTHNFGAPPTQTNFSDDTTEEDHTNPHAKFRHNKHNNKSCL